MYNYEPATKYLACYLGPQEMLSQLNQSDGSPVKDMPAESPTSTEVLDAVLPESGPLSPDPNVMRAARRAVDCTLLMVY